MAPGASRLPKAQRVRRRLLLGFASLVAFKIVASHGFGWPAGQPASAAPRVLLQLLVGFAALALLFAAHVFGRRRTLALSAVGGKRVAASFSEEELAEAKVEPLRTAFVQPAVEVERLREAGAGFLDNTEQLQEENKQLNGDAAHWCALVKERRGEDNSSAKESPPARAEETEAADQEVDEMAARAEAALRLAQEEERNSQAAEFHEYTPTATKDLAEVEFAQDASDAAEEAELELQRVLLEVKQAEEAAAANRSLASAGGELQRKLRARQQASESAKEAELQRVQEAEVAKEAAAANCSFASAGDELQRRLRTRRQASELD